MKNKQISIDDKAIDLFGVKLNYFTLNETLDRIDEAVSRRSKLHIGVVNAAKSWFTIEYPDLWLFALGFLFIAVTLFFPKGIAGGFRAVVST